MPKNIYKTLEDTTKIAYRYINNQYQKKKQIVRNLAGTTLFLGMMNFIAYNNTNDIPKNPQEEKIKEYFSIMEKRTKKLEDSLLSKGGVSLNQIKTDAQTLQKLGIDITPKDLYFVPGVISGEAGMYFQYENPDSMHRADAIAISSDILNRYLSSIISEPLKKKFSGFNNPTLCVVALRKGQYSTTMINPGRVKQIRKNFEKKNSLTYAMPRRTTTRAYAAFIETLKMFVENPSLDPTGFAIGYKNDNVKSAAKQEWQDSTIVRGYTFNKTTRIGEHDHYEALDVFGNNPVRLLREGTAGSKRYTFSMATILKKRKN